MNKFEIKVKIQSEIFTYSEIVRVDTSDDAYQFAFEKAVELYESAPYTYKYEDFILIAEKIVPDGCFDELEELADELYNKEVINNIKIEVIDLSSN